MERAVAFYRDVMRLEATLGAGDGVYYELAAGDARHLRDPDGNLIEVNSSLYGR